MRLTYLAIVLAALAGCAKKQQPEAKKPVPASTTPSDPQPTTEAAPAAAAPAPAEAPAPGSRSPVKKGGDPEDGGQ